jgi:mRNA interferase YafQ
MKKRIVASKRFEKSYRKHIKKYPNTESYIRESIKMLSLGNYSEQLSVHKLSGNLKGLYAFSCGYDCRIIFSYEELDSGEEIILLVEIGKHDEVY